MTKTNTHKLNDRWRTIMRDLKAKELIGEIQVRSYRKYIFDRPYITTNDHIYSANDRSKPIFVRRYLGNVFCIRVICMHIAQRIEWMGIKLFCKPWPSRLGGVNPSTSILCPILATQSLFVACMNCLTHNTADYRIRMAQTAYVHAR